MERVNRILSNGLYQEYQKEIDDREKDRIYCRHNIAHLMDVARIAEILNCENGSLVSKELIYATALLHDCGRHIQYDKNIPHEIVGAELAEPILRDCGFEEEEILHILQAIRLHRTEQEALKYPLAGLIYRADKKSRLCMCCNASDTCHKKEEGRNLFLTY